MMNFAALYDDLEKESLFDLWRLNIAIARAMEDPRKIAAIRFRLRVGQSICYFDAAQNREFSGRIIEIKRTRAVIRHDHDQQIWTIPFHMMKLDGTDDRTHFARTQQKMDRDSIRVGDSVGYVSREHRQVYGTVVKRNHKTATVRLSNGELWKVTYSLLFPVIEATAITARENGNEDARVEVALITRVHMSISGEENEGRFVE
jgi:hypothetical protein